MKKKFIKITIGFVVQTFEENKHKDFVCTEQNFVAGDQEDFENENGEPLTTEGIPPYQYQPYTMTVKRIE